MTESLIQMNQQLNGRVVVAHDEALAVFEQLSDQFDIQHVFSHHEVGLDNTFQRDKQLKRWFSERHIVWQEEVLGGVMRGAASAQK